MGLIERRCVGIAHFEVFGEAHQIQVDLLVVAHPDHVRFGRRFVVDLERNRLALPDRVRGR